MFDVDHALHYHIIHVNLHGMTDEGLEQLVHESLVSGPCVLQSKRHYLIPMQTSIGYEQNLLLVFKV